MDVLERVLVSQYPPQRPHRLVEDIGLGVSGAWVAGNRLVTPYLSGYQTVVRVRRDRGSLAPFRGQELQRSV
jgi:hypothetical protein